MRNLLLKALSVLQLVRLPLALAVGSDLWLAALLARWNPEASSRAAATMNLWLTLAVAGLVGGGMLGFAAGMNDLLDQRRDQAMNPGRPLPAGRMRTAHAAMITFGSLVTATSPRPPSATTRSARRCSPPRDWSPGTCSDAMSRPWAFP